MTSKKSPSDVAQKRPNALNVLPANIPQLLKSLPQWLCWKYEYQPNRAKPWTKPPYNALTGYYGKSNDPATWSSFDVVLEAYQYNNYDGIGFAFKKGDGLAGIDLDECILEDGTLEMWAQEIVDHFRNTYWEISPSGEGLRCFCKGIPAVSGKKSGPGNRLELYDYRSPRYLTVTGHLWRGK